MLFNLLSSSFLQPTRSLSGTERINQVYPAPSWPWTDNRRWVGEICLCFCSFDHLNIDWEKSVSALVVWLFEHWVGWVSLKKFFLLFSHSFQLIMRLVTFVLNWIGVYTGCIAQGQDNIPFITVTLTLGGFKMEWQLTVISTPTRISSAYNSKNFGT